MKTNIKQHDETDCGAACIASVARFYGRNIPIAVIRENAGTSFAGTTIKGIIDACREIGFKAEGYKSPEKDMLALEAVGRPLILHLVNRREDLHFVVLYRCGRKKSTIMDPATGSTERIATDELKRQWTGYLVMARPDEESVPEWNDRIGNPLTRFSSLLNKSEFALMMASSIVYVIAGISTALFLQHIIDKVIPSHDTMELARAGSLMLAIMICTLFLGYGRIIYSLRLNLKMDSSLVMGYLRHLFRLPAGFFCRRGAGELNSRVGDITKIRAFVTEGVTNMATSAILLAVSFTLMFTCQWRIALLMLLFIPVYLILYVTADRVNRKVNREIIEESAAFEERTVESITAVRVIKYFGEEDSYFKAIRKQYANLVNRLFNGGRYMGTFASWSDAISKLLTLTLLTAGSALIFAGSLTIGELVSFYSLTAYFSAPLSQLVEISNQYTEARISAERIGEIFDLPEEGEIGEELPIDWSSEILIDNIEFSYPGNPVLIKDFSMTIRPGRITVLRGESGCGKSSIASLLMRDYSVQKGNIYIGDTPIGMTSLKEWRKFISIVPQDAPLMNGTILENITCHAAEPDYKAISSILENLGLKKFIKELPLGLLTKVGERGSVLSGGQRQRIALARAIYHNPQVLILDEATSSLDDVSRDFILKEVLRLKDEGKAILMITHKHTDASIADYSIEMNAHS